MTCKVSEIVTIPLDSVHENSSAVFVRFVTFTGLRDNKEHIALLYGEIENMEAPYVRLHSECMTGDLFHSRRCDCGEQLTATQQLFEKDGGVLLYLRQEGRGIGLYEKLKAYTLQQNGMDTYEANIALGHKEDQRDFTIAADMLKALNITHCKLLTNNPEKYATFIDAGINVTEVIPLMGEPNEHNRSYIDAKILKMKKKEHLLDKKVQ